MPSWKAIEGKVLFVFEIIVAHYHTLIDLVSYNFVEFMYYVLFANILRFMEVLKDNHKLRHTCLMIYHKVRIDDSVFEQSLIHNFDH